MVRAKPVDLVGHSLGGQTARYLQHLLAQGDFFDGYRTSAAWVRSITALSSPLNGTTLVYGLGENAHDCPETVPFYPGPLLGAFIHLVEFLDVDMLKKVFPLRMDHWQLSWRKHKSGHILGAMWECVAAMTTLPGTSRVVQGKDNAAYDMTVHAARELNATVKTQPGTYYFSFVATHGHRGVTLDGESAVAAVKRGTHQTECCVEGENEDGLHTDIGTV